MNTRYTYRTGGRAQTPAQGQDGLQGRFGWHDSSLDLARGLVVIEHRASNAEAKPAGASPVRPGAPAARPTRRPPGEQTKR